MASSMRLAVLAPMLTAGLALPACGGDDDHGGDDTTYDCAAETSSDTFLAGMTKTGPGGIEFTLVSSTPAPPSRGDNLWEVALTRAGAPLTGATLEAVPFMPAHQHGPTVPPVVSPGASDGRFEVTPVNMWMPGVWEITLRATPAGGTRDEVVFRFCIPG